jgi:hypothetical protein
MINIFQGCPYFTGRQHAGEDIADVLKQRDRESRPAIQMCDPQRRQGTDRQSFLIKAASSSGGLLFGTIRSEHAQKVD